MSEEERLDIVEGVDEEGNRLILRVNRYFFYNGEEYVLLSDDIEEPNPNLDEVMFYVMKVTAIPSAAEPRPARNLSRWSRS